MLLKGVLSAVGLVLVAFLGYLGLVKLAEWYATK